MTITTELSLNWLEQSELHQIAAESIGWLPLESGAYLHVGKEDDLTIEVVGIPDASMTGQNVLLLGS